MTDPWQPCSACGRLHRYLDMSVQCTRRADKKVKRRTTSDSDQRKVLSDDAGASRFWFVLSLGSVATGVFFLWNPNARLSTALLSGLVAIVCWGQLRRKREGKWLTASNKR